MITEKNRKSPGNKSQSVSGAFYLNKNLQKIFRKQRIHRLTGQEPSGDRR